MYFAPYVLKIDLTHVHCTLQKTDGWDNISFSCSYLSVGKLTSRFFMFAPCIINCSNWSTLYTNHRLLKQFKIITNAPTCFGSRRNHHQGAVPCLAKTTKWFTCARRYRRSQCYGGTSARYAAVCFAGAVPCLAKTTKWFTCARRYRRSQCYGGISARYATVWFAGAVPCLAKTTKWFTCACCYRRSQCYGGISARYAAVWFALRTIRLHNGTAPWWWLLREPKHVGAFVIILNYFNTLWFVYNVHQLEQ